MMICHYFSFLIDEIGLDWWNNNILLFLFSVLTVLNLICEIRPPQSFWTGLLDLAGRAFILGWHQRGLGRSTSLGLASGPVGPFF